MHKIHVPTKQGLTSELVLFKHGYSPTKQLHLDFNKWIESYKPLTVILRYSQMYRKKMQKGKNGEAGQWKINKYFQKHKITAKYSAKFISFFLFFHYLICVTCCTQECFTYTVTASIMKGRQLSITGGKSTRICKLMTNCIF